MLQKPNTVFVAKKFNAAGSSFIAGDVRVIDASTGAVIDLSTTNAITANAIQLEFKKFDNTVTKSAVIGKTNITHMTADADGSYVAKTVASSTIDFTNVVPVIGHRYVIRCIYRDIYEHPGQFTHSYEYIAKTIAPADLAIAFNAIINASTSARVTSTIALDVITLTAKSVTDNGFGTQGKEAITPYSQVQMRVVAYTTNPASQFNSAKDAITGLVITNIESKPGKGNPYIVRDREQAALGYKGITYRTEFPVIKPELNVDLTATYDTLVIEFNKQYQSPDNQYVKFTDLAAEIYIVAGATASAETLGDKIRAWIA